MHLEDNQEPLNIMAQSNTPHKKGAHHAWSISNFETYRPHLTTFVRERIIPILDEEDRQTILVRAPVKSGKREMVEYIAQRDACHTPRRVHSFVSAWYRTADEEQREELKLHNMKVYPIRSNKDVEDCSIWMNTQIQAEKRIVLHIDECDFGTGDRQNMATLYRRFRTHPNVCFILYSATPQEVMFSGELNNPVDADYEDMVDNMIRAGEPIEYTPPSGYCGPARFLQENLVENADRFFHKHGNTIQLSEQGQQIMDSFRAHIAVNPRCNIIILRLSYSYTGSKATRKDQKAIYHFLNGAASCEALQDVLIFVDKNETAFGPAKSSNTNILTENIKWSNEIYWKSKATGIPSIFVIDQTASRSTELKCHDRIYAYHDFRNTVTYTTVSQAQERVNHYDDKYSGGFQQIRVYGHLKTFQMSAGLIDYDTYMNNEWYKRKIHGQEMYHIKNKSNKIHPDHAQPLTSAVADNVLHTLGCLVEVEVSSRVRGRVGRAPIIACEFMPCDENTIPLDQLRARFKINIHNPFIKSKQKGLIYGKYQGYLREWAVFQYEYIQQNRGWGMEYGCRITICYHNTVLGIAIRAPTGEYEPINTLQTFRSMYQS